MLETKPFSSVTSWRFCTPFCEPWCCLSCFCWSITFYWSCSAADGDIYFNTGARKYGTGDLNITYPVAGFDLTPSAAWTLYKHTFTQTVGDYNSNSSDDNLLIINFSRYGYQPSTYGDTNTGNMYVHGIKIGYSTN